MDWNAYQAKYKKEKYDDITVRVPKGGKAPLKAQAAAENKTLNRYILDCIEEHEKSKEVTKMTNLQDITGQESGIVIYEGGTAIICNWSHMDGIPMLSPFGEPMEWKNNNWKIEHSRPVTDVLEELDGIEIMYDRNGDIQQMITDAACGEKATGTLYKMQMGLTVIAPEGWA